MKTRISKFATFLFCVFAAVPAVAQTTWYKCNKCGRYHAKNVATTQQSTAVVQSNSVSPPMAVVPANAINASSNVVSASNTSRSTTRIANTNGVLQTGASIAKRWRFDKANNWTRRIDPRAQAWAQEEANRLARRRYQGYLQNGHPGGNNPYAKVTGTGTTFPGDDLIHTCEGSPGMTLVAEAAAVSSDGRIYGVRSWR